MDQLKRGHCQVASKAFVSYFFTKNIILVRLSRFNKMTQKTLQVRPNYDSFFCSKIQSGTLRRFKLRVKKLVIFLFLQKILVSTLSVGDMDQQPINMCQWHGFESLCSYVIIALQLFQLRKIQPHLEQDYLILPLIIYSFIHKSKPNLQKNKHVQHLHKFTSIG